MHGPDAKLRAKFSRAIQRLKKKPSVHMTAGETLSLRPEPMFGGEEITVELAGDAVFIGYTHHLTEDAPCTRYVFGLNGVQAAELGYILQEISRKIPGSPWPDPSTVEQHFTPEKHRIVWRRTPGLKVDIR